MILMKFLKSDKAIHLFFWLLVILGIAIYLFTARPKVYKNINVFYNLWRISFNKHF